MGDELDIPMRRCFSVDPTVTLTETILQATKAERALPDSISLSMYEWVLAYRGIAADEHRRGQRWDESKRDLFWFGVPILRDFDLGHGEMRVRVAGKVYAVSGLA